MIDVHILYIFMLQSRPKRLRLNPIRKWLASEERLLVEFLMENRQFEVNIFKMELWLYCINMFQYTCNVFQKPTAQSYYRRFCSEKNVTMDWQQVRAKVRNMRVNYNKAKTWENSTGVGNMDGSAIKSKFYFVFFLSHKRLYLLQVL